MKKWQSLSAGDIVDIIAPASPTPEAKLEEGEEWLRSIGLTPHRPQDIFQRDLFFASPLELQLEQLKEALYSDSKAIWCARGGYGSMRLIPHLKKLRPPKRSKILLGFSDITALHLFFTQNWGWTTFHSANISGMSVSDSRKKETRLLKDVLLGKTAEYTFTGLIPLNEAARNTGTIRGKLTGGNLRILQSSLGTDWELQTKNKILFFEDVGERGYSVHRMLEQLRQAKLLHRGVKAVVAGQFTESEEKNGNDLVPDALMRFAQEVSYPVFKNLPSGHGKTNYPLPLNTVCELSLGKRGTLKVTF